MFENTEKLLARFLEVKVPGYDIAVYKDGKCIFRKSDGYVDMENRLPFKGDELYYMYSMSKPITVTAAMMLWEEGKFKLSDKLSKYLPEYENMTVKTPDGTVPAKNPILMEDVLCMTAGFHYRMGCPSINRVRQETEGRCPTREVIRAFASEPLEFEPGTSWFYSFGHDVLGAVIEVISGERLSDFIKRRVLVPAGMKRATFAPTNEEHGMICPQYKYDYGAKTVSRVPIANVYELGPEYESGGAGMVATLEDIVCFCEAMRTGKLLKSETIELMTEDRLGDGARREAFTLDNYGYGLGVRCPRGDGDERGDGIFDFGWSGAAGAHLSIDIKNGITVAYAQHILNFPNYIEKRRLIKTVTADVLETELCGGGELKTDGKGITY